MNESSSKNQISCLNDFSFHFFRFSLLILILVDDFHEFDVLCTPLLSDRCAAILYIYVISFDSIISYKMMMLVII